MSAFYIGITASILCIVLSVAGMAIVRKTVKPETLKVDHDVTSALIAVLGTLYAIVLGLVVVDALAHREQAEMTEANEANALATVMHLCRTLPVEQRRIIMQSELDYINLIIDKEWPKLNTEEAPDPKAVEAFGEIWFNTAAFNPKDNRETDIHNAILSAVTDFSNARRYRLVTSKHGLPSLLWLTLVIGGMCTIAFTYFFGAERLKLQAVMTSMVALVLCLNMLLVYFYGSPYKGDLAIEPKSLIHVRDVLRRDPALKKENAPALEKQYALEMHNATAPPKHN